MEPLRRGTMRPKTFESAGDLSASAADLILSFLRAEGSEEIALMLAGGITPLAAYDRVAKSGLRAPDRLYFFLSDERMVPPESSQSNHRSLLPLLQSLSVPDERIFRIGSQNPIEEAAHLFHLQLKEFLEEGGAIPLGFLGLGADGHTASLFSPDDVKRGEGRYAIAVSRPSGPDRVSVTPELLHQVDRIVFLVTGDDKREALDLLLNDPESLPAGWAVRDHAHVEVWFPSRLVS